MSPYPGTMGSELADAASPYLRSHAGHPVAWRTWSAQAFAQAARRDVPVMVSIGYASCHWCHVMSAESFADPDTAELLNREVVAIKVDREEHPEVDAYFLAAAAAFTPHLGWPLTVFTTPDGHPFFAGTYWPDEARGGLPAFRDVIGAVGQAWRERRDAVADTAAAVQDALRAAAAPDAADAAVPTADALGETARAMSHDLPEAIHREFVGVHREVNDQHLRRLWGEHADIDAFNAEAEALFDTLWRAGIPLRPGAAQLLEMLAKTDLPIGLCTSTRSPKAQEKLRIAGFIDLFASIVTLNDVENPKPHPQPYLISARNLGVAPERCVVVEDSPNGLRSGAAAGMTVLLVPDLVEPVPETRALAHAVLPDLHAVADWIADALAR